MSQSSLHIPNLDKLIAHLEALAPSDFNMSSFAAGEITPDSCGTPACIAGWALAIKDGYFSPGNIGGTANSAAQWLGLPLMGARYWELFGPDGYQDGNRRFNRDRAIATLQRLRDRFLATGEVVVDWGPEPGEEPAQPWAAPQARELTPPVLPETITRFLAAEPVTTGTEGR